MRVLTVHNEYREPGGEDKVVEAESRLLRENGIALEEVRFRSSELQGMLAEARVAWELPHSPGAKIRVAEAIERFRPDVLHVHNFFPLATPSIFEAAKGRGVPTVLTLHNYRLLCANGLFLRDGKPCELCVSQGSGPAIKHRCYQGSLLGSAAVARMISAHRHSWEKLVDRFIVLTEFSKSRFVKAGLSTDRFEVKPNFLYDPGIPEAAKASASRPKILFVGRLSAEKGLGTLLAARALDKGDFEMHIVGDGPLKPLVTSAAATDPGIHWHGRLESAAVYALMRECSLVVFPSECYENFPIVILEAMALGKALLVSKLGGLPEILEEGVSGAFFQAGNPADLAEQSRRLWKNPALLASLGTHARKRYLERFTPEKNLAALLGVYEKVIS